MEIPSNWPQEIRDKYSPIRILGKGGFASVILAKRKTISPSSTNNNKDSDFVAIKVAGNATTGVTKQQRLYGHREIDILRALHRSSLNQHEQSQEEGQEQQEQRSHPNIMKCLDYAEPTPHTAMILVLSYSPGPTVDALLKQGGALSTIFGRVVIAQLVDAVTYLHSHAVVHRDIKPDNIIVTGAIPSKQPEIWDNPSDIEITTTLASMTDASLSDQPDWDTLRKKWHVTLVDFGFARALTKADLHQPSEELHRENADASFHRSNFGRPTLHVRGSGGSGAIGDHFNDDDRDDNDKDDEEGRISRSSKYRSSLSGSLHGSRHQGDKRVWNVLHRSMSALGTAQFAAPEIRNKVVKQSTNGATTFERNLSGSGDITRTISPFVADYGVLVDAYSLGCTIRYMMTGCQPHQSVAEAKANQNNVVDMLCGMIFGGRGRRRRQKQKMDEPEPRTPHYRYAKELPGEVQRLIETLTVHDPKQRASVWAARRYPWINDFLPIEHENRILQKTLFRTTDIQYLDFTAAREEHILHTPVTA